MHFLDSLPPQQFQLCEKSFQKQQKDIQCSYVILFQYSFWGHERVEIRAKTMYFLRKLLIINFKHKFYQYEKKKTKQPVFSITNLPSVGSFYPRCSSIFILKSQFLHS